MRTPRSGNVFLFNSKFNVSMTRLKKSGNLNASSRFCKMKKISYLQKIINLTGSFLNLIVLNVVLVMLAKMSATT